MDITAEQVDRVRSCTGASYEQARAALLQTGGNVLDAVILLEQQGAEKAGADYSTRRKARWADHSAAPPGREELKQALSGLERRDVVTFHEAFPYFAHAYGLNVAAVLNQEPDDALSPRQLADLVRTVRQLGNPPLFVEPQYEDLAAQTIARDTGAQLYILDPMATGPEQNVPLTLYEDVMRRNLQVLLEALGQ
jgi:zinc transport system substrate-binding protein